MNICIFGSGAIGSYIGALLMQSGVNVSLICRGEHLKAIQQNGLLMQSTESKNEYLCKPIATDNPNNLEKQDFIIVTLKAHSAAQTANMITPLLKKNTTVVSAVNGLPWWYFYKSNTGTSLDNKYIESVDPNGKIWNTFKPERAIGCVVYPACEITEPGVIKHNEGERFSLGEPDGTKSARLKKIADLLIAGGLKVPQKKNLRDEIWIKLWGNCSFNPVSALTNKTLDEIGNDKELISLVRKLMEECKLVGERIGAKFNVSIDDRIKGAISVIGHKPSTTQDLNSGKPLEIDPIIGSIIELANKLNIETPNLKSVNSRLKIKAEKMGLYQRSDLVEKLTS